MCFSCLQWCVKNGQPNDHPALLDLRCSKFRRIAVDKLFRQKIVFLLKLVLAAVTCTYISLLLFYLFSNFHPSLEDSLFSCRYVCFHLLVGLHHTLQEVTKSELQNVCKIIVHIFVFPNFFEKYFTDICNLVLLSRI